VRVPFQLRAARSAAKELADRSGAVTGRPAHQGRALISYIRAYAPVRQNVRSHLVGYEAHPGFLQFRNLILRRQTYLMRMVEGAEILTQLAIEHIGRSDGQSVQRLRERVVH